MRIGMVLFLFLGLLYGKDELSNDIKSSLRPNMIHIYDRQPGTAESLRELFNKGEWYGRLRTHLFVDKWGTELQKNGISIRKDSSIVGIGGSFTYKTAYYHGFGATAGLYFTNGIGSLDRREAYLYKSGKDAFSRYDRLTDGDTYFATFAEAYLEYRYSHTHIKAGRQIFESFLTKSNDGKMIPNTFEGVSLVSHDMEATTLKAAYFTKQKLRDHSSFHHVLAYGYVPGSPLEDYTQYTQNDDSAMHKGLTLSRLEAAGINDRLIVLEAKNESIEKLALTANYTGVPELLSSSMLQADYTIEAENWTLRPGVRYMQQFDNGAGAIGGASLKGKKLSIGYRDPSSVDSWLFGARLDAKYDALSLRAAYTKVADKADIVAPWRGFPTGGFTRLMGQYNWNANTKVYVFMAGYDWKAYDTKVVGSFAYQDFDDAKMAVSADNDVLTLEVMHGFDTKQHIYWKARYAHVWGDDHTPLPGFAGKYKPDPSYDELRVEVDYLF